MVEVFKTDVESCGQAKNLLEYIHKRFENYQANFDLEDCDKILRVECTGGLVIVKDIINLVEEFGYTAEVLSDTIPSIQKRL